MPTEDLRFMEIALKEARRAAAEGEVPVGAALVWDGELVSTGYNRREADKNALSHAELIAISGGCGALGGWRLHRATLYVTLEPCPMCAGAIINARIARVVFGAKDPKAGCFGSVADFCALPFNHSPEVASGVLEQECAGLLREFFRELRGRQPLPENRGSVRQNEMENPDAAKK